MCAASARTAKEPIIPRATSLPCWGWTTRRTLCSTRARAARTAITPATPAAAVFEILMIDAPLRRLITAGASADELADEARRHGFTTMRERCRDLVLRGETTAEEAARTISSTIES